MLISLNKAANANHYPRAAGPILGYDSRTTTKSLVDSAALRGSRVKMNEQEMLGRIFEKAVTNLRPMHYLDFAEVFALSEIPGVPKKWIFLNGYNFVVKSSIKMVSTTFLR